VFTFGTADAKSASGGGVRGGEAAPRNFFGWFLAASPPKPTKNWGVGRSPTTLQQPREFAQALPMH
jgi:hypothetical protein